MVIRAQTVCLLLFFLAEGAQFRKKLTIYKNENLLSGLLVSVQLCTYCLT